MERRWSLGARALGAVAAVVILAPVVSAQTQTPIAGHYPPGQSGVRGAASPPPGWSVTNFSRFFSNLEAKDPQGNTTRDVDETRYANITMVSWTTRYEILGLQYGALAGFPFVTGNLNPSTADAAASELGVGDILVTLVSLYGRAPKHDHQFQFTVWSPSGHFSPGSSKNRGTGFWALVYSLGGVWYPTGERNDWSLSAVARVEQNFEQAETGVQPGDDIVVDWGVAKVLRAGETPIEVGASGFGTWQLSQQSGGSPEVDVSRYRYFGAGPEAGITPWEHWSFRVRAHWEFLTRNAVEGNNLWIIVNYATS